jgi:hypothetical protein
MTPIAHAGRERVSLQELDEELDRLPFGEPERAALWLLAHHTRQMVVRVSEITL